MSVKSSVNKNIQNIIKSNFKAYTEEYAKFAVNKDKCRACKIYNFYKQVVQSEGNAKDPIFMFVGEAPGRDEVAQVKPFVGKAGQLLRSKLKKYPEVFNKKTTIISNLICCRPENNIFPSDTDGKNDVRTCYRLWLFEEINLLKPKIVVTLGNYPLFYLRSEHNITSCHGSWKLLNDFKNIFSFCTFHPSYVLRCLNNPSKQHIVQWFDEDIAKLADSFHRFIKAV